MIILLVITKRLKLLHLVRGRNDHVVLAAISVMMVVVMVHVTEVRVDEAIVLNWSRWWLHEMPHKLILAIIDLIWLLLLLFVWLVLVYLRRLLHVLGRRADLRGVRNLVFRFLHWR